MYDQEGHKTSFSGFSIALFEGAVKLLPYHLPYILIPFVGTYDEMVVAVYNKVIIVSPLLTWHHKPTHHSYFYPALLLS